MLALNACLGNYIHSLRAHIKQNIQNTQTRNKPMLFAERLIIRFEIKLCWWDFWIYQIPEIIDILR